MYPLLRHTVQEDQSSTLSPIPSSSSTFPVMILSLTDLNHDTDINVELHNQPIPYVKHGGKGTLQDIYLQEINGNEGAIQQLPTVIRLLLSMLPADTLSAEVLIETISSFTSSESQSQSAEPRQRSIRSTSGRGSKNNRKGSADFVSSSQPLPSTRPRRNRELSGLYDTWNKGESSTTLSTRTRPSHQGVVRPAARSQSQPEPPRRRGRDRAADHRHPRSRARIVPLGERVTNVCESLLSDRAILFQLTLYRASIMSVEHTVTTIFSVEEEVDQSI